MVWIGPPDEGFCFVLIMLFDKAVDGRLQINDRSEDAIFEASSRQFGEKPFYCIEP